MRGAAATTTQPPPVISCFQAHSNCALAAAAVDASGMYRDKFSLQRAAKRSSEAVLTIGAPQF